MGRLFEDNTVSAFYLGDIQIQSYVEDIMMCNNKQKSIFYNVFGLGIAYLHQSTKVSLFKHIYIELVTTHYK